MNTKNRLLAKTGDISLPEPVLPAAQPLPPPPPGAQETAVFPAVTPGAAARGPGARTAPGQLLDVMSQVRAKDAELERLRAVAAEHDASLPTRLLDPKDVLPSAWANRHDAAFRTPQFERLKADIQAAGGNVQPIRVRPAPEGSAARWELIFGHRRHRACLDLGLPVLAITEQRPVSDADLFALMDRENRERADLSAFEQGMAYKRALDAGLFASRRRMAEHLGVSHTWVSNALAVAELPAAVIEAFRSPLEVQHRHARQISAALEADGRAVLRRAERLRQQAARLAPGDVTDALLGRAAARRAPTAITSADGQILGKWRRSAQGGLSIELAAGSVAPGAEAAVMEALVAALRQAGSRGSAAT